MTELSWDALADRILAGAPATRDDALRILRSDDADILSLLAGAFRLRRSYYGTSVKLNVLINAQSGRCGEDCAYCSQSIFANTPVDEYPLADEATIVEGAKAAKEQRAGTYCIVMSGRRASKRDVESVSRAVKQIKEEVPQLKICACLGLIDEQKADTLREAGVDRFNHNINTSAKYHNKIVSTHHYEDRVRTIEAVKSSGISPCSGIICGMGESDGDLVDAAWAISELDIDSIPINFLIPQEGTRLADLDELTPVRCLKVVAMFRYLNPTKEIRLAGGREVNLRSLQPLALYAANSVFLGDYLTSDGQSRELDYQIIRDLGFTIEDDPYASGPKALGLSDPNGAVLGQRPPAADPQQAVALVAGRS